VDGGIFIYSARLISISRAFPIPQVPILRPFTLQSRAAADMCLGAATSRDCGGQGSLAILPSLAQSTCSGGEVVEHHPAAMDSPWERRRMKSSLLPPPLSRAGQRVACQALVPVTRLSVCGVPCVHYVDEVLQSAALHHLDLPPSAQGLSCPSSTETRCRRATARFPSGPGWPPSTCSRLRRRVMSASPGGREGDGSALETCPRARSRCSSPRRGQWNVSQPPRCLEDAGNGERETAGSRLRITSLDH
jgi:hypothetical protein